MAVHPLSRGFSLLLREIATQEPGTESMGRSVYFRQAVGVAADLLDAATSTPQLARDTFPLISDDQFRMQFEVAAARLRAAKTFADASGLSPALLRNTDDARLLHAATGCDPVALIRETAPGRESRRVTPEWRLRLRNNSVRASDLVGHGASQLQRPVCELIEDPSRWIACVREQAEVIGQPLDSQLFRLFQSSQLPPDTTRAIRDTVYGIRDRPDPNEQRRLAAHDFRRALAGICERFERGDCWGDDTVARVTSCFRTSVDSSLTVQCLSRGLQFAAAFSEHRFAGIVEDVAFSQEWRMRTAFGDSTTPLEAERFASVVTRQLCEIAFEPLAAPVVALHCIHADHILDDTNQRLADALLPCEEIRTLVSAALLLSSCYSHHNLLHALSTAVDLLHEAAKVGWAEFARADIPARSKVKTLNKQTERLREAAAAHLMAASRRGDLAPEAAVARVGHLAMLFAGTGASKPTPSDGATFRAMRLQLA